MAVRIDAATDQINRTANLPSLTALTVTGWSRVLSDTGGAIQPLFLILDGTLGDGIELLWDDAFNNMAVVVADAGAATSFGTLASRPATGTDFAWYLKCAGTGTNLVQAGWRAAGSNVWVTANCTLGTSIAAPAGIYLGGVASTYYCDHRVWNVKCWDRALSDAELHWESEFLPVISPQILNFWYPLDRADVIRDYGPNRRDPTLGGTLTTEATPISLRTRRRPRRVLAVLDTVSSGSGYSAGAGYGSAGLAMLNALAGRAESVVSALALGVEVHARAARDDGAALAFGPSVEVHARSAQSTAEAYAAASGVEVHVRLATSAAAAHASALGQMIGAGAGFSAGLGFDFAAGQMIAAVAALSYGISHGIGSSVSSSISSGAGFSAAVALGFAGIAEVHVRAGNTQAAAEARAATAAVQLAAGFSQSVASGTGAPAMAYAATGFGAATTSVSASPAAIHVGAGRSDTVSRVYGAPIAIAMGSGASHGRSFGISGAAQVIALAGVAYSVASLTCIHLESDGFITRMVLAPARRSMAHAQPVDHQITAPPRDKTIH